MRLPKQSPPVMRDVKISESIEEGILPKWGYYNYRPLPFSPDQQPLPPPDYAGVATDVYNTLFNDDAGKRGTQKRRDYCHTQYWINSAMEIYCSRNCQGPFMQNCLQGCSDKYTGPFSPLGKLCCEGGMCCYMSSNKGC